MVQLNRELEKIFLVEVCDSQHTELKAGVEEVL